MIYHTKESQYEVKSLDSIGLPKYSVDSLGYVYGVNKQTPLIHMYRSTGVRAVYIRGRVYAIDQLIGAAFYGIPLTTRCRIAYIDGDFSNQRLENIRFETMEN